MNSNYTDTPRFSKKPVPTKFRPAEEKILKHASQRTGLTNSDLIRRAVLLMGREHSSTKSYSFLLELSA